MNNWPQILKDLRKAGMTLKGVAHTTNCNAKKLYHLAAGTQQDLRYSEGERILELHRRLCGPEKQT